MAILAKFVAESDNVDEDNIDKWTNCNTTDPSFEHITSEQMSDFRCNFREDK